MIGRLSGVVRERDPSRVLIDVGGVGYLLRVPMSTFLDLPQPGSPAALLVSTQVREDSITLYGFLRDEERDLFERLLTVSGVGPRTALAALSALGSADLARAIADGDVRRLSGVPGIGKKTAERLIVDLRDKVAGLALGPAAGRDGAPGLAGEAGDVVSALVNLGYNERQASKAVQEVQDALERPPGAGAGSVAGFEPLLRESLRRLGRA